MVLASVIAQEVDRALYIIGGISLVLLVAITAAMIYFVIRYGHKRSPTALQISGNNTLEIIWTVVPTIIVLFMFYVGFRGFLVMRNPPSEARVVRVIAQQWFWIYEYPEEDITSDMLHLPAGEPCRFELTSRDVIHSFYIPAFRVKEDCLPGKTSSMWIDPDREGTFNIFCAEYCGLDHASMVSKLVVLSPEDYQMWVRKKAREKYKAIDMVAAMDPESDQIKERDGPQLYTTYCASCHGPDGKGGLVEGARNLTSLTGWKQGTKRTDIFRTLTTGIPGAAMRSFAHLPAWDRFALMHYVVSFDAAGTRATPDAKDVAALVKEYRLDTDRGPPQRLPIEQAMRLVVEEAAP
jgi:cytochrome c oxidase subunit 2